MISNTPRLNDTNVECAYLSYIAYEYLNTYKELFNHQAVSNSDKIQRKSIKNQIIEEIKKFLRFMENGNGVKYIADNKARLVLTKVNGGASNYLIKNNYWFTPFGTEMYNYFRSKDNGKFDIQTCKKDYDKLGINLKKLGIILEHF